MLLTDIDDEFLDLLECGPSGALPAAGVVGDISRTWYADKDLMLDLFEMCVRQEPEFHIAQHGAHGFDLASRDAAICAGADVLSFSYVVEWERRFGYRTDPSRVADAAWFLLVLPRRETKGSLFERCYSVDPGVFEVAYRQNIPIFALSMDGKVRVVR